jgi:hypothetical protein
MFIRVKRLVLNIFLKHQWNRIFIHPDSQPNRKGLSSVVGQLVDVEDTSFSVLIAWIHGIGLAAFDFDIV